MSYFDKFNAAILRSKQFGFTVPKCPVLPEPHLLTEKIHHEFPYQMRESLGELDLPDLVAQCLSIHYRMTNVISSWLQCEAYYTLGWIDDGTERGMFRFDESFIENKLRNGHSLGTSVNIHAWITLPSMEIIDASLATSIGYFQKRPEALGRVIAKPADEIDGFSYEPMLIGDDFLRKSGILLEF